MSYKNKNPKDWTFELTFDRNKSESLLGSSLNTSFSPEMENLSEKLHITNVISTKDVK